MGGMSGCSRMVGAEPLRASCRLASRLACICSMHYLNFNCCSRFLVSALRSYYFFCFLSRAACLRLTLIVCASLCRISCSSVVFNCWFDCFLSVSLTSFFESCLTVPKWDAWDKFVEIFYVFSFYSEV